MVKWGVLRLKLIVLKVKAIFFFDFAHFQKSKPNFSLSKTLCFSFYSGAFQDFDELFWDWNCSFSEIGGTFYFWRDFWFGRLFKYQVFLLFDQYQDPFKKIRILKITLSNFRLAPPLLQKIKTPTTYRDQGTFYF